jgi:hypothetical protein
MYILACWICGKYKKGNTTLAASQRPIRATKPSEYVPLDSAGPFATDIYGMAYIMVIICAFSRCFTGLFPAPSSAADAADALLDWSCNYGLPTRFRSDQRPQYDNKLLADLSQNFSISHEFATGSYYPQAVGIAAIVAHLRVRHRWSRLLPFIQRILNACYHRTLGTTPFSLVYGATFSLDRGLLIPLLPSTPMTAFDYLQRLDANLTAVAQVSTAHLESYWAVQHAQSFPVYTQSSPLSVLHLFC